MEIFIVEALLATTHTFVRADIEEKRNRGGARIIDINEQHLYSITGLMSAVELAWMLVKISVLHPICVANLLLSSTRKSNLKALVVTARLWREFCDLGQGNISAHFLGKASVVASLLATTGKFRLRLVCHASDLYVLPRRMDFILRSADIIETVTWFGKGFVFGRLGQAAVGKVVMKRNRLPAGRDIADAGPRPHGETQQLKLLAVARLAPQKDLEFALRVVMELAKLGVDVVYKIAGTGPLCGELIEMACDLGIAQRVIFVGEVRNEEARALNNDADAILLPCAERSLAEADGLPVVFQEALSAGCPVFCRSAFGVAELILNGVNGWAFDVESSPRDWAETIRDRIGGFDRSLIKRLSSVLQSGRVLS